MNHITFHCSQHGEQKMSVISVGLVESVPVRIILKCGCAWIWSKDEKWEQQTITNGLQELARKDAAVNLQSR